MTIKIIGLLSLFAVCAIWGMQKSFKLHKRVSQIEGFCGAISLISSEIRCFATPIDVLLAKLDSLEEYKRLCVFGLCRQYFNLTNNFSASWERAVEETKNSLALNFGDYEEIKWFGKLLGTKDIVGEVANCERYRELLEKRLDIARVDCIKKGRMYGSLGVLTGTFLFVLFF